jgi:hypothetical protein
MNNPGRNENSNRKNFFALSRYLNERKITMKITKVIVLSALALSAGFCCLLPFVPVVAAEPDSSIPAVIRAGFVFFQKQHPEQGVDTWKEGGLVGEEFRSVSHANYFKGAERTLGKYDSYELIATKMVGRSSKVIYVSINYERGAVYTRFLVYRADKDWVVQSMDFSTKPEALMPWLAFESEQ